MQKGRLIAFEGIDGSGKTTQIELLKKYLDSKNSPYEIISFPQYGKNEYAKQVEDYLAGKFGQLKEIDPYFIAKAYASDRLSARDLIKRWLESGKMIICNRYIPSFAHLAANLEENKRKDFLVWVNKLEYETNSMPKEDLVILLDVDPKVGQQNSKVQGTDIHEQSFKHLQESRKIYLQLAKENSNWYVIDCMSDGEMRGKEEIHQEVVRILENYVQD